MNNPENALAHESCRVLIAVQAGGSFGYSRLARARAIVDALNGIEQTRVELWLESQDVVLRNQLKQHGVPLVEQSWTLSETLRHQPVDRLVLDYANPVPPSLMSMIRATCPALPVVVVDNVGRGALEADTLILGDCHRQVDADGFNGQFYQGLAYVVFGQRMAQGEAAPDHSSLLVSIGSEDNDELAAHLLECIRKFETGHIDFMVPAAYKNPESLERSATRCATPITLHWQQNGMQSLVRPQTRFALCAFGLTAYELAYNGIPMLVFAKCEADMPDLDKFCQAGLGINIGLGRDLSEESLMAHCADLMGDTDRLAALSRQMTEQFSGNSPDTLARIIMQASRASVPVV